MGEEAKKESPKAETKPEQNQEEEKKEPKPPSPCVLSIDLHCVGCAKKIKKYIMKMRGVEGVDIEMAKNEVTIKGIIQPQAICNIIVEKTKKKAQVISPLPEAEGELMPKVVNSQASEAVTVGLNINMHCEACAEQLKKKILKMRGVQTAVTELSTGKVTVTGTMDANKLVDYIYRRTKKQVKIVPQLEPEPEKKEETNESENLATEEDKPEEEKEVEEEKKEESAEEPQKEEVGNNESENKEEKSVQEEAKKEVNHAENGMVLVNMDDENMKKTMYYYYQPLYVLQGIPSDHLFSDENPNACSIS